jgi:hypothetical protein
MNWFGQRWEGAICERGHAVARPHADDPSGNRCVGCGNTIIDGDAQGVVIGWWEGFRAGPPWGTTHYEVWHRACLKAAL